MAGHVRRAAKSVSREVRILMDLAGPKLRTGPVASGPTVLKLRPRRDYLGRILAPAYVGLRPAGATAPVADPITAAPKAFGALQFHQDRDDREQDCKDSGGRSGLLPSAMMGP